MPFRLALGNGKSWSLNIGLTFGSQSFAGKCQSPGLKNSQTSCVPWQIFDPLRYKSTNGYGMAHDSQLG